MNQERHGTDDQGQLARSLNTPLLALYGAGTILGAGIYVLIGKIAGAAGLWTPLAFLLASTVAAANGMVLAELSTRVPRAGGPTDYVDSAFGQRWFSTLVGWMIVATGVVSAATITTGFSGYLTHFYDTAEWIPRAGLLILLGGIAISGVKESAWFMAATTTIGLAGLLFVTYVGFFDVPAAEARWAVAELPPLDSYATVAGIFSATFLAIYSFIGFEDLVHLAEEVKKPSFAMPRAIAIAVAVAAVMYVVVSIAALRIVDAKTLDESPAPLVAAIVAKGYPGWPLALLSLAIIVNGALAQLIMATRVIYRLGQDGGAPHWMASVHESTSTPIVATLCAAAVAICLALFFPLATLASATSFIMLLIFAFSNVALMRLKRQEPTAPFTVPRWLPWVGLGSSVALAAGSFLVSGGGH